MSLLSILSNSASGAGAAYGSSSVSATIEAALAKAKEGDKGSTADAASSASISAAAQLAAAEKADGAKDFAALTTETRAALDTQYAAGASRPDLSKLSGRALAAIALNRSHDFTAAEVTAARAELKGREKATLLSAISGGMNIASLASYGKSLATAYDGMSAEEREARGWTDRTRSSFAAMADTSKVNSLFDALRQQD